MTSKFSSAVSRLQAQQHRDLAKLIETEIGTDKDALVLALRIVLTFTALTSYEIANALGVTSVTVDGYAKGDINKKPYVIEAVRKYLVEELNQRADMLDAFHEELGNPQDDYIRQGHRVRRFKPRVL